ncbi:MAG: GNAT family N-acetyltransferase [Clostridia bacterium]|nr:GNAT family N-acetyltransferase [Deltaproteobacteria bacterium]
MTTTTGRNPTASLRVRAARIADAADIARVHVDSWRETYTGIIPESYLRELRYPKQEAEWKHHLAMPGNATFVAEDSLAGVVGFANGGPERSGRSSYFAELYVLYLLERYHSRGIGSALICAFARELTQIGLLRMLVWVLSDNPARGFYEALGGRFIGETPVAVGGARLIEVAYGWHDVRALCRPGRRSG